MSAWDTSHHWRPVIKPRPVPPPVRPNLAVTFAGPAPERPMFGNTGAVRPKVRTVSERRSRERTPVSPSAKTGAPSDRAQYVLLPDLRPQIARALIFPNAERLAREIHARRRGATIQLADQPIHLPGRPEACPAVAVYTLDEAKVRDRFIGWACCRAGGRLALEAALLALEPRPAPYAEEECFG